LTETKRNELLSLVQPYKATGGIRRLTLAVEMVGAIFTPYDTNRNLNKRNVNSRKVFFDLSCQDTLSIMHGQVGLATFPRVIGLHENAEN